MKYISTIICCILFSTPSFAKLVQKSETSIVLQPGSDPNFNDFKDVILEVVGSINHNINSPSGTILENPKRNVNNVNGILNDRYIEQTAELSPGFK